MIIRTITRRIQCMIIRAHNMMVKIDRIHITNYYRDIYYAEDSVCNIYFRIYVFKH